MPKVTVDGTEIEVPQDETSLITALWGMSSLQKRNIVSFVVLQDSLL